MQRIPEWPEGLSIQDKPVDLPIGSAGEDAQREGV